MSPTTEVNKRNHMGWTYLNRLHIGSRKEEQQNEKILQDFEGFLEERVRRLETELRSNGMNLVWMEEAMKCACETHERMRMEMTDAELGVETWEQKWIDDCMEESVMVLDLCIAINFIISTVQHSRLVTHCALDLLLDPRSRAQGVIPEGQGRDGVWQYGQTPIRQDTAKRHLSDLRSSAQCATGECQGRDGVWQYRQTPRRPDTAKHHLSDIISIQPNQSSARIDKCIKALKTMSAKVREEFLEQHSLHHRLRKGKSSKRVVFLRAMHGVKALTVLACGVTMSIANVDSRPFLLFNVTEQAAWSEAFVSLQQHLLLIFNQAPQPGFVIKEMHDFYTAAQHLHNKLTIGDETDIENECRELEWSVNVLSQEVDLLAKQVNEFFQVVLLHRNDLLDSLRPS